MDTVVFPEALLSATRECVGVKMSAEHNRSHTPVCFIEMYSNQGLIDCSTPMIFYLIIVSIQKNSSKFSVFPVNPYVDRPRIDRIPGWAPGSVTSGGR